MTNLTRGSQGPLIALRFRKTMTAPPSPLPLFDPEAVEKLRAVAGASDPGFVADVAQVFLEEATGLMQGIRDATAARDWKTASRSAHSVKSSSATLGLLRLSAACRALELSAHRGEGEEATVLAEQVFQEFEAAVPAVRAIR